MDMVDMYMVNMGMVDMEMVDTDMVDKGTWLTWVRGWRGGHGHDGHGHVLTQCNAALIVIIIKGLTIFESWHADLILELAF